VLVFRSAFLDPLKHELVAAQPFAGARVLSAGGRRSGVRGFDDA